MLPSLRLDIKDGEEVATTLDVEYKVDYVLFPGPNGSVCYLPKKQTRDINGEEKWVTIDGQNHDPHGCLLKGMKLEV